MYFTHARPNHVVDRLPPTHPPIAGPCAFVGFVFVFIRPESAADANLDNIPRDTRILFRADHGLAASFNAINRTDVILRV